MEYRGQQIIGNFDDFFDDVWNANMKLLERGRPKWAGSEYRGEPVESFEHATK